ncbi:MAG: hypothetical protein ABR501_11845 [Pyrinomonadaceae bacterium]
MKSTEPALAKNKESALPTPAADGLSTGRWAFINGWTVVPQADDRSPKFGSVLQSTAPASVRRSTARRRHQVMHKEWSRERHD